MSMIHAACCEIIAQLKRWKHMSAEAQSLCFQHAYQLFSRPFLQGLTYAQKDNQHIRIMESPLCIFMTFGDQKETLFYSQTNPITGIQCTCQQSWQRKTTQNLHLVCKHQIAYILLKYCFNSNVQIERIQGIDELAHILSRNKL